MRVEEQLKMSRDESLLIKADCPPDEILQSLFAEWRVIPEIESAGRTLIAGHPSLALTAFCSELVPPEATRTAIYNSLGFNPNISLVVTVAQETYEEWEEGCALLIRAVLGLIRKTQWDIYLDFSDNDIPVLLYTQNKLTLSDDPEIWTPERLAMIEITYEVKNIGL